MAAAGESSRLASNKSDTVYKIRYQLLQLTVNPSCIFSCYFSIQRVDAGLDDVERPVEFLARDRHRRAKRQHVELRLDRRDHAERELRSGTCFTCVVTRTAARPSRIPGVNFLARARGIIVQLSAITMAPCKVLNSTAKAPFSGSTSLDFIAP